MWVKIKKKAFTLAEVLITLGIIGVVAAITIPSLMTAYEKHVTISKLQRAISVLNQAYRLSVDDLGEVSLSEALNLGSEEYFNTYWAPYLKAITVCTSYSQCGYKSNNPWLYPNKNKVGLGVVVLDRRATFYTADGFLYVLFISMGSKNTESGM